MKKLTSTNDIYNQFWKQLVEKDNKPNLDFIKKELADYYKILQNVPKVYKHISGHSSPFTDSSVIISDTDYHYAEKYDQEQAELIEKYLEEPMLLAEVLIELKELRELTKQDDRQTERVEDFI